eukprot:636966-Prymnesium_polylepis.1
MLETFRAGDTPDLLKERPESRRRAKPAVLHADPAQTNMPTPARLPAPAFLAKAQSIRSQMDTHRECSKETDDVDGAGSKPAGAGATAPTPRGN